MDLKEEYIFWRYQNNWQEINQLFIILEDPGAGDASKRQQSEVNEVPAWVTDMLLVQCQCAEWPWPFHTHQLISVSSAMGRESLLALEVTWTLNSLCLWGLVWESLADVLSALKEWVFLQHTCQWLLLEESTRGRTERHSRIV